MGWDCLGYSLQGLGPRKTLTFISDVYLTIIMFCLFQSDVSHILNYQTNINLLLAKMSNNEMSKEEWMSAVQQLSGKIFDDLHPSQ